MRIKAIRNFIFKDKFIKLDEICEMEDADCIFLIEHDFAICLDKPEKIAEQPPLDMLGLDRTVVPINKTKRKGKAKKNA